MRKWSIHGRNNSNFGVRLIFMNWYCGTLEELFILSECWFIHCKIKPNLYFFFKMTSARHISRADGWLKSLRQPGNFQLSVDIQGFPGSSDGKQPACNVGDPGLDPWVENIRWRREWQLTPVFLPGESHGQRSPVGYSLWGHKESYTTEQLTHTRWYVSPVKVAQFCPTLCHPMDYTVHGILQARILLLW